MKKTYMIDVDCINCAGKMELAASKTPGVAKATVNFMAQKLVVEFREDAEPDDVMQQVRKACRKVSRDCEVYL